MKKSWIWIALFVNVVLIAALIGVYGFFNGYEYWPLWSAMLALPETYFTFGQQWFAQMSFSGLTNLVVLAGTGLAFIFGLLVFVRGLIIRRPLLGLIAFVSTLGFILIPTAMTIPNAFAIDGLRYFNYLLDGFTSNLFGTLYLVGMWALIELLFLIVVVLGFLVPGRRLKAFSNAPTTHTPPLVNSAQTSQPQTMPNGLPSISPATTTPSGNLASDASLNDLVKMVMNEELSAMRSAGYPQVQPAVYPVNMVNPSPYGGLDVNLVRRIVVEELAKFQSHYISRPEVQTLIAQEIAVIKAQLKIK